MGGKLPGAGVGRRASGAVGDGRFFRGVETVEAVFEKGYFGVDWRGGACCVRTYPRQGPWCDTGE